jgi:imidazoleglycerol phosphate dehydratase HisB
VAKNVFKLLKAQLPWQRPQIHTIKHHLVEDVSERLGIALTSV